MIGDDVIIEMMSADLILWRCLHGGPLTSESVGHPDPHSRVPWERLRARNVPLLAKLTDVYGACAVTARHGEQIVGILRFYPRSIWPMAASGPGMCMQQAFPNGPADDLAQKDFLTLDEIADKTLAVHCLMTGSPQQEQNPFQRKGIGSRLVRALADWALDRGWQGLEATAYADLPCIYGVTGCAGRAFYEKLGFRVVETGTEPAFAGDDEDGFVRVLLKEAADRAMDAATAKQKHRMRLDLT